MTRGLLECQTHDLVTGLLCLVSFADIGSAAAGEGGPRG
jgi:hypothetical protein